MLSRSLKRMGVSGIYWLLGFCRFCFRSNKKAGLPIHFFQSPKTTESRAGIKWAKSCTVESLIGLRMLAHSELTIEVNCVNQSWISMLSNGWFKSAIVTYKQLELLILYRLLLQGNSSMRCTSAQWHKWWLGLTAFIMCRIVEIKVGGIRAKWENATRDPKVVEQGIFLCHIVMAVSNGLDVINLRVRAHIQGASWFCSLLYLVLSPLRSCSICV